MRRRLRSLVTVLEHARESADPRRGSQPKAVSVPVVHHSSAAPVHVPEFNDPGQLSAAELKQLRDELRDELSRATFTSDSRER